MRSRMLIALAMLTVVSAGRGWAQETTGAVVGRITDAQGLALPGATVTLTGPQGAKTVTTDAEGRYNVPLLVPGTYVVRAELQGFKGTEQKDVVVRLGQTIEVPLSLQVGGVSETVEVSAASPIVDTRSTTVGAVIDSAMLANIPIGRRFSDALYVAPGVTSSGSAGRSNPSLAGGSGLDNTYVVDGVNITNTGYGALGSYSIIFGSLGNGTPYDFIKEVQVKTGGYEAEFGQAIGGVVNVVTKSGSNKVSGSVFGYARPSGTEGDWKQFESDNGTVQTLSTELNDVGATLGGPVLRDRIFFFGAIDPSWETRTFQAPNNVDPDTGERLFPLYNMGGIDRKRQITSYSAKGTWQITANHHVDASFFGDPAKGDMGPQRTNSLLAADTSQFSELNKYGGNNQTVKYDGVLSPKFLVEASYSHARNQIEEIPSVNEWFTQDFRVVPTAVSGGIGFYEAGNDGKNNQYGVKVTNILGSHQLRYGVTYEDIAYDQINQRTGPTFTLPDGTPTATGAQVSILPEITGLGQIYRVGRANMNSGRNTKQHYTSVFVQDTFAVGNRLTIKPGIRYEQQTLVGTIVDDFTLKNNWAPRIGATYDIVGNGRSKLFANWGRFFAKIPNDLAARALSSDAGVSRADYYDANLTQPIPEGVPVTTQTAGSDPQTVTQHFILQGVGADLIDPDAKSSYVDEFVGGFEYEAFPNINLGVKYIHRSIPRVLEDVGPFPVGACDFLGEGCSFDYTLTNPDSDTPVETDLGAKYEKPVHNYDAVQFTADKRLSNNWALQASYTWSRLNGTFEGFYREDNGQSDPGITSLYDFPTDDPSYTAIGGQPPYNYLGDIRYLGALGEGPLPLDRPHVIKLFGNYTFNMGLNLGAGVTMNSGKPLTALASNPNYTNGGEIPLTPRGEGFQTVDGFKKRTPFEYNTDLHADYALKLGGARRIVVLADVFNVFNLQRVVDYDNFVELEKGVTNPDFGQPVSQNVAGPQYQSPRQIRFGARFEF
jgi:Carboxypeptidase regulatory-like domain/TonB-dependent Receptor Plug Domain